MSKTTCLLDLEEYKYTSYAVSEIDKLGPHSLELRRKGLWR